MNEENALVSAMRDLDEDKILECIENLDTDNVDKWAVMEWLQEGMREVGSMYEQGEYFIADLIVAGILFRKALSYFPAPISPQWEEVPLGHILIGVMEDDIHDIGKDIVRQTLEVGGFDVIDLGIDVKAQTFVDAVRKYEPDIVMLCGLMSFSANGMEKIICTLTEEGLRDSVIVIVGGSCINGQRSLEIGADYFGGDPSNNLNLCKKLMEEKKDDI